MFHLIFIDLQNVGVISVFTLYLPDSRMSPCRILKSSSTQLCTMLMYSCLFQL